MWSSGHDLTGSCICGFNVLYAGDAIFTKAPQCPVNGHLEGVVSKNAISFAFSPDGKRVVSWGNDKLLVIWDSATGAEVRKQGVCALSSRGLFRIQERGWHFSHWCVLNLGCFPGMHFGDQARALGDIRGVLPGRQARHQLFAETHSHL